ncbi:hypothetical protein CPLU01_03163 [Colletotrichum plurivorum]|uniref:Uncharacterized protein n=1 Tax=Colletotrichum plurivorum TaxID=2175906 RepID=A0A8H6KTB8_9PEZI|nr:hypothetical protein CPLU01_03163 [Colletotrichum plurivorum]
MGRYHGPGRQRRRHAHGTTPTRHREADRPFASSSVAVEWGAPRVAKEGGAVTTPRQQHWQLSRHPAPSPLSARFGSSPPSSQSDRPSLAGAKSEGMKDSANLPPSRVREAPRAGTRKEARRNARSLPLPPALALVLVSPLLLRQPAATTTTQPVGGIDRQATLFQGPASQPDAREDLPCAGRCPKSERLQIFMPQGGMHQWRPQAGEVCGFRSRSRPGVYRRGEAEKDAFSIWKNLGLGRSRPGSAGYNVDDERGQGLGSWRREAEEERFAHLARSGLIDV